jgi:hypothetical protein
MCDEGKGWETNLVVGVTGRNDVGGLGGPAVLRTLISTLCCSSVRIRINPILLWVVTAFEGAVRAVDRVEEVL